LRGKPSPKRDWHRKKDENGKPLEMIFRAEEDRISFWNSLQDMAGVDRVILEDAE